MKKIKNQKIIFLKLSKEIIAINSTPIEKGLWMLWQTNVNKSHINSNECLSNLTWPPLYVIRVWKTNIIKIQHFLVTYSLLYSNDNYNSISLSFESGIICSKYGFRTTLNPDGNLNRIFCALARQFGILFRQ